MGRSGRLALTAHALLLAWFPDAALAQSLEQLARGTLSKIEGEIAVPGLHEPVEVIRDRWGVPHIYAQNTEDLFFAQGYVQAQDRLWQMEMWRRYHGGRLAEIMGPEAVAHDKLHRLLQFEGPIDDREFASYHPEGPVIFTSFVNGINAFIAERRSNLPVEFQLTGIVPEPWTLRDLLLRTPTRNDLGHPRSELNLARQVAQFGAEEANRRAQPDPWIELTVPPGLDVSIITQDVVNGLGGVLPERFTPPLLPRYRNMAGAQASLDRGTPENSPGSNNWVVSGRHTASGRVLLSNDPHRAVTNPSLRYLVHLNAPGWNVIGSTEPELPGVNFGTNGRVAWGATLVGTDYGDVFVEEINPADANQARWQGEWYPLRVVTDTIEVLGEAPRIVQHKYSRNGAIFYEDAVHHRAYAFSYMEKNPGTAEYIGALQFNQQSMVSNCREFLEAARRSYRSPAQNLICGDVDGNIAWQPTAFTPKRVGGWIGRLPVPGTGEYRWDGARNDLPYLFNPESGWIATANDNILTAGYHPPLFVKRAPYPRGDRIRQLLSEPFKLTAEDFKSFQNDDLWPYLDAEKGLLRGWTAQDPEVEWARTLLLEWDGHYRKNLVAPSVHNRWLAALDDGALEPPAALEYGASGSAGRNVALSDINPEREALARAALEAALAELRTDLGPDRNEWRWGRLHRSEFPHWLVSAFDLPAVERNGGGNTVAATGATYKGIYDLSNLDNSWIANAPGQSGQPMSEFYGNLLDLWASQQFFPLAYSRPAVEAVASKRLMLRPQR